MHRMWNAAAAICVVASLAIVAGSLGLSVTSAEAAESRTSNHAAPDEFELQTPSPPPSDNEPVNLANGDLRKAVLNSRTPRSTQSAGKDVVVVEVLFEKGDGPETRDAVRDVDGEPGITVSGELVQAEVPIDGLEALEADPAVEFIRPPLDYDEPIEPEESQDPFSPSTAGNYAGEQISKTNADAWHAAGITGAGVKVGIIDSFDSGYYNDSRNSGDIPAISGSFCRYNGGACNIWGGGRHGIGVAEALIDMAPKADIYFASATSAADTQAAMDYFHSQGVKVVTRSETGRYDGPGDGTGPIATVIQESAIDKGMFYLNAAGNSAGRTSDNPGSHYRGNFTDVDADGWHEFAPGRQLMRWDCSYANGLRWSDWGEGSLTSDYDLFLYSDAGGTNQIDSSQHRQGAAGAPPLELATDCGTNGQPAYAAIKKIATNGGDTSDTLQFMTNGYAVEFPSNPYSASGPMSDLNSAGAVSVGAVDPAPGTTIAPYSAEGPTTDGRIKPDLSAAACVKTLSYFFSSRGCFDGTSSSTPVTAGAAALALSGSAANSPQTLKKFLLDSTIDRGATGPDNIYGQGELLLPDPAVGVTGAYVPVGQISPGEPEACTVGNIPQIATGAAPSYTVSSDGVITEWSHNGRAVDPGSGGLQVWRSAGGSNYTLVGKSTIKAFVPGKNSFPINLAVKAGDLIGLRIASSGTGCYYYGGPGDVAGNGAPGETQPDPQAGETQAFDYPVNGVRANISATFSDTTGPETTINSGPSGGTNNKSPSFVFSADEADSKFECRNVDRLGLGAEWSDCSTPKGYSNLLDGDYRFEARATDRYGRTESTPAFRTFTVDTSAPGTNITSGPSGPTSDATPTFAFSANGNGSAGSSFECEVDGGGFGPCSSPHTLASLANGDHTFRVLATDPVGNVCICSSNSNRRNFTVDTKLKGSASAKKKQKQKGKNIVVKVKVGTTEDDLAAKATGKVVVGKSSFKLKPASKDLAAASSSGNAGASAKTVSKVLKLVPKKNKDEKKIVKALKKGKKVTAKVTVKLTDEVGNKDRDKVNVKLKR